MMSDYDVQMIGDGNYEFEVVFKGPEDSALCTWPHLHGCAGVPLPPPGAILPHHAPLSLSVDAYRAAVRGVGRAVGGAG